ncbi:AAA family ATPase [Pedobacter antarcticus]|uniref:AAA family ATPase n=1 Tax=Pedobacter antarcticus TaxID=34086 RepID=UPI0029303E10|nr:AAA family ATPase [Pedobacter antarcticus]
MELKKATRKQVKLRLNISAPSGAGKTFSALRMAYGICGDWNKIAVVDTENGSASLYSNLGEFNVIDLTAPFTPEKYIQAINTCVSAGMEVIILDSTTHEWNCILEENELLAQAKFKGNTWSAWSVTTPRHDKFLQSVLQCPAHVITCTRSKMETALVENNGRKEVKKIGLKDQQREGWEYELTVSLNIDRDTHFAIPSKDRTNLFEGKNPFLITEETGKSIADWCNSGVADKAGDLKLREATTLVELANIYKGLSRDEQLKFADVKDEMKSKLSPPELNPATSPSKLPSMPADRIKKLMTSIKKEGADITGILKSAREQFSFTPDQEKDFNSIIVEKATKKQVA